MSLLNFDGPSGSSGKSKITSAASKPLKLILGVGVLAAVIGLGSTLAANIALNTGAPIEFGQGVAQTTSCDSEVILTPISTFVNAEGAGAFRFSGITLSGLDTTDQTGPSEGCAGKSFTIKAYDDNGVLLDPTYTITVGASAFTSTDGNTSDSNFGEELSSVTLTFDPAEILATDVYRITIESSVADVYYVGETGPGGGIIYYVDNETGFNCGATYTTTGSPTGGLCHYLEVAPYGWNTGEDPAKPWAVTLYESDDVVGIVTESTANNSSAGIGLGYKNSVAIVDQNGVYDAISNNYAAGAARAYRGGLLSDWYLPALAEMNVFCQWNRGVPTLVTTECVDGTTNSPTYGAGSAGIAEYFYWSSSENSAIEAWLHVLAPNGQQSNPGKSLEGYVRPVRAF